MAATLGNPFPSGTEERTDQGVDFRGTPGAPILAPAPEVLMGTIKNWFQGQPFQWFKILSGPFAGKFDYVAEQFRPASQTPGTVYQQGQAVGSYAPTGTGIETGFATASGQTLAKATTGYQEGQVTPAGTLFRNAISAVRSNQKVNSPSAQQNLTQLWIQAGGSPKLANIMAAIAMAESSGNIGATNKNSNGTVDRGLWQINSSHSQFDPQRLLSDPLYNAQAAVSIEKSQGLTAWTTYNTGAYQAFLASAATAATSGAYGGTRPGGQPAGQSASTSSFETDYANLIGAPRTAPRGVSAQDVSLTSEDVSFWGTLSSPFKWGLSQIENAWSSTENDLLAPVHAVESGVDFMDKVFKFILNPIMWLRAVEFIVGILTMGFGIKMLMPQSGGGRSNSEIRKITSNILAATPPGRAARIARGRREGTREGQTEYARNEARRASKAREAQRAQRS